MRILLTGQVGLNKSKYLEEIKQKATKKGYKLEFESIGQKMIENYTAKIDDATILNLPKAVLDLLRQTTWKQILNKLTYSTEENYFYVLNTHSVFRWHHGLFPALDLKLIAEFAPDMVLVLIDDILEVKKGLQRRNTDLFQFWELLAWREEEIWFSKFIADSMKAVLSKKVNFFIVPKSQGSEFFLRLITKGRIEPKVYISFPITGAPSEEQYQINLFKEKIMSEFIAFDPYSIKDRELTFTYYTVENEIKEQINPVLEPLANLPLPNKTIWRPYYKDNLSPLTLTKLKFGDVELLGRELLSAIENIDSQIISRDYLLIDQADFVMMYIRMDDRGNPSISAGCQSEMVYAYSGGKKVYVVFAGGERKLSPWVTQFSEVFTNLNDAFNFILSEYKNKKGGTT